MNERIRVLAEQAKFIAEETINKKISKNAELDAFAEKFAELIVRECAEWMDAEQDEKGDGISDNFYWSARMRKHFGVEE